MVKHQLWKGVVIFSVLLGNLWAVEITSNASAVNIAGKQRMFTQRMLKDYAMVGMGNTFGDPKKDLAETIDNFGKHLKLLQAYAKSDEEKKSLDEVEVLWQPVEKILANSPNLEAVTDVQKRLDALLKASDNATKMFAEASEKKGGEIVNISGRQRMLSQRMAGLYMLKVWGLKDAEFKQKLDDAMKHFRTSHEKLTKVDINTEEIKKRLTDVGHAFMFFEMMNRSTSKFIPSLIYKKSNDILKKMNEVTELYVKEETK